MLWGVYYNEQNNVSHVTLITGQHKTHLRFQRIPSEERLTRLARDSVEVIPQRFIATNTTDLFVLHA